MQSISCVSTRVPDTRMSHAETSRRLTRSAVKVLGSKPDTNVDSRRINSARAGKGTKSDPKAKEAVSKKLKRSEPEPTSALGAESGTSAAPGKERRSVRSKGKKTTTCTSAGQDGETELQRENRELKKRLSELERNLVKAVDVLKERDTVVKDQADQIQGLLADRVNDRLARMEEKRKEKLAAKKKNKKMWVYGRNPKNGGRAGSPYMLPGWREILAASSSPESKSASGSATDEESNDEQTSGTEPAGEEAPAAVQQQVRVLTPAEVNEKLKKAGVKSLNRVSGCVKAGIARGLVKLDGPEDLKKVIVRGICRELGFSEDDECNQKIETTLKMIIHQKDWGGNDYEDPDNDECGARCRKCRAGYFVSDICTGHPNITIGKWMNHCNDCKDWCQCLGDYRDRHCGKCGEWYYAGGDGECDKCAGKPEAT